MNVLDAKVINTCQGLELYLDSVGNVEIKKFRFLLKISHFMKFNSG